MTTWIFRMFDLLKGPRLFEIIWHILTGVSALTETEINAASSVLGIDSLHYASVRIAEGGLLKLIFKFNENRAFTTFLRWSPSLGQDRGCIKIGSRYPQWVWC